MSCCCKEDELRVKIRLPAAQGKYFNATDYKEKSSGLPERSAKVGLVWEKLV